jgi:hypothetical protein
MNLAKMGHSLGVAQVYLQKLRSLTRISEAPAIIDQIEAHLGTFSNELKVYGRQCEDDGLLELKETAPEKTSPARISYHDRIVPHNDEVTIRPATLPGGLPGLHLKVTRSWPRQ